MFFEIGRLLWLDLGRLLYLKPNFHFKYPFFEFIEKFPDTIMYGIFYVGTILSVFFILGFLFRITSILLFLVYTYLFLLDPAYWNNHYYFYVLVLFLFMITDSHRGVSVDKKLFKLRNTIPNWHISLFLFQVTIVYFYGGLSKCMNTDWLNSTSAYTILYNRLEVLNISFTESHITFFSHFMTYFGLIFDLSIAFVLLWRRSRWLGVFLVLCFNISNHFVFNIGSFPFAMIATLILFFPAKKIRDILDKTSNANSIVKIDNDLLNHYNRKKIVLLFISIYCGFQLLFPLRHFLYEGNMFWTGEGKFCSWHMMSGDKNAKCSEVFTLLDVDKKTKTINAEYDLYIADYLNAKQVRVLGVWPYLIPQFMDYIKEQTKLEKIDNIEVYGDIMVTRNNRPLKHIVDPMIDLTELRSRPFGHNEWILLYSDEGF